jgi:hypothetical protein
MMPFMTDQVARMAARRARKITCAPPSTRASKPSSIHGSQPSSPPRELAFPAREGRKCLARG